MGNSLIITTFSSEVTLNSTSSVLSYNHFDFGPLFSGEDKVRKEKREHTGGLKRPIKKKFDPRSGILHIVGDP